MQVIANGSRGHHRFTLEVVENVKDDSIATNTTYIDFTFKISAISSGYDWNSWGNKISYRIDIGDNVYTGTIPAYNGTSTVTLKYANNVAIVHESDGTKTLALHFKVTDGANQTYTCGNAEASDTMILTALHKAPLIVSASITAENNTALTNLTGFQTATVVQYLSKKTFTISSTLYDGASITKYEIYHNGVKIGESNTNTVSVDFSNVGELQVVSYNPPTIWLPLIVVAIDSLNGRSEKEFYYHIIQYTKPTIQKTISTIKRKSGNGAVLTDNICLLNFTGSIYKGDDVVGNANSQQLQYKIWNTTEPGYTNLSSTLSSGVVTKVDYQINNILYTKSYDYKIKIKDLFIDSNTSDYVKSDRVPTGTAVWSEYKDRVDFLKLTVGGQEVVSNKHIGNYAKIKLNTRYTLSQTAWSKPQIDFTNNDFSTNSNDDFEVDTHGIVCKFSGTVLILKTLSTSSTQETDIMNDSNTGVEIDNVSGHNTYANYVQDVTANQLIDLRVNSGNTSFTIYEGTQMSIIRIK